MTDILTITPNPAVDLSTSVEKSFLLTSSEARRNGVIPGEAGSTWHESSSDWVVRPVRSILLAARWENCCASFSIGEGVVSQTFAIADETREDFFVSEIGTGQQYRFILPGPRLVEAEWQECLKLVSSIEPFPHFVVASGSLPAGVPDDFYARIARIAKQRGARMILDTSGKALAIAVAEGVDLIKPNLREMRELSGSEPSDAGEWEEAARAIVGNKRVAVVALTMGHLGAALITPDRVLRAKPLAVTPLSAVGAGDSFLAALIWRLASGADLADCFRQAVAAGAAALLNPGTELCRPHDVERLAAEVIIEAV